MNNYNNEYEYEVDEVDKYEDVRGYEVLETCNGVNFMHWFRTYDEIFDEFGEMVVWDFENEMYIVHHENEHGYEYDENVSYEDDRLEDISKFLPEGCNVIINEL